MGNVFVEISMSMDGFVTGENLTQEHPFGHIGERLHTWMSGDDDGKPTEEDREAAEQMFRGTGAFLIGRRTFDLGEEPWGDDGAFGKPSFVVTNRERAQLVKGPTTFTFVTDGIESALAQAKAAAGDADVCVMGGANLAQQYLGAGLVDELRLHLIPVVVGAGARLFDQLGNYPLELTPTSTVQTRLATHLRYRVAR
jgi:dihydrofolate reductase